jgi:uncharacterized protein (DUF924 family)
MRKSYVEHQIQKVVELGRENARLYPKVVNWCRHLQVHMRSSSPVAESYKLPVGLMEIICEHASAGGILAMQLHQVATSFIVNNCQNCPFHEVIDIDNVGYSVLKAWEDAQEQRRARDKQVDIAKKRLRGLVSGDLTEALRRANITEQSILQLVVLLEDETHHIEAAKKLVQASEIAAELFSRPAIEVICNHFPDPDHGQYCIACIRHLHQLTEQDAQVVLAAARDCLAELHHADDVCALIGDYVVQRDFVPEAQLIDAIADIQWHGHVVGISLPRHREYPGSTYALTEIGKRDLGAVFRVLKTRLAHVKGRTRLNTAHIVQSLIDTFPDLALDVIDPLIDSLELPDDSDEDSVDETICETLAAIYVRHPRETQEKLESGCERASLEVRAVLYDVYRYIVLGADGRFDRMHDQESNNLYHVCIPRIISYLLQALSRAEYPIEVKEAASDALEIITEDYPDVLVAHLDTLLGTLANLVQEQVVFADKKPDGTLGELEKQGRQAQYSRVVRCIVSALEAICSLEPRVVLSTLKEIVPRLDSTQPHMAHYKCELAALYGQLGTCHELTPDVIPALYKLLMDFDSALVRGAAINALTQVLQHRANVIPHSMLEVLILYLNDSYIYVNQSATRAMCYVHPSDLEEATTIAYRLVVLDKAYEHDPYFRKDILSALIHTTQDYPELLVPLTTKVLAVHARIPEEHVAQRALETFEWLLPRLPDEYQLIFAREVLAFLGRSHRDPYSDESFSGRHGLLLALFDLPKEGIVANLGSLQEVAHGKAKDDPWDALRMVQLASYFELYAEAAQLGREIAAVQPQTKRHEAAIREATFMGVLAEVESLVVRGQTEAALQLLQDTVPLEAQRNADEKTYDVHNAIDTFSVAERIAKRTAGI